MLQFTEISFWLVFVFFLAIFALMRRYSRMGMLLYVIAFSLLFFWLANGWLMLLLPSVALATWLFGRFLRCPESSGEGAVSPSLRRWILGISILLDLTPLLYFKYSNFFLGSVHSLLGSNFAPMNLALPVGISFFTFQAISYLVDLYRGRFTMQVSFLEFLFYLSFFPLLLAGPITRAETLFPQMRRVGKVSERCLYVGLWLVMLGLLKKCLVADYIAQFNDWVFDDPQTYSGFECLMGILGYSVQIYCDFSGYSDMSIGMAALMGFHLRDNFAFPYRAVNLSDFWRRWHISLSSWFRDYLYIPLGGNRCSRTRTYINNILTMLVAGLWHGASWMFVLWGAIHGIGLVFNKVCKSWTRRLPENHLTKGVNVLFTFSFVAIAWVFFRSTSVESALSLLSRSVSDFDLAYFVPFVKARPWWCLLVILPLLSQIIGDLGFRRLQTRFICLPWWAKMLLFLVVLQLILQFKVSNVQPFIYYQF